MKAVFTAWSSGAGDITGALKRRGYAAKTHSKVYCYVDSKLVPLIFQPEYPEKRPTMSERASGSA